jgi:hypothetical protein
MPEHRSSTAIKEKKRKSLPALQEKGEEAAPKPALPKLVTCAKPGRPRHMALARRNFWYIRLANPSTLSFSIRAASGYYTVSPVAGLSNQVKLFL